MARRPLRISTARLTIRPLTSADVTTITRYRNNPDVARFQEWNLPYTRDSAHQLIEHSERAGRPLPGDWVQLGVADETDQLVGDVAVWLDDDAQLAVIGYTLAPEHQRRGYAAEAVGGLVDWLFRARGVHRIAATLDPMNLASARVLERCGFRYVGTAKSAALVRGAWSDDTRFELIADDWRAWKRSRRPVRRVDLVTIDRTNLRQIGELDRAFSQRRFVSTVYQSYADALVPPTEQGYQIVPWMRALHADRQPAGFVMVASPIPPQPHPYLWRFLVDWRFQGRGVGRLALAGVARHWHAQGATHLLLGCVAGVPGSPEGFYRKLGFVPTGRIEHGETEMMAPIDVLV